MDEKLKKLDNEKLIDVVKNYRQYGYEQNTRDIAISILEERGITKEQLELTGKMANKTYDLAEEIFQSFTKNSRIAFVLYTIAVLCILLLPFLSAYTETSKLPITILKFGAYFLYFIFLMKSFFNQSNFYKVIGKDYGAEGALLYIFIGMPFYFFMYFYFRNQMKEKMTEIK